MKSIPLTLVLGNNYDKIFWFSTGSPIFYYLICKDSKAVDKILNKTVKHLRKNYCLIKVSNSLFWVGH